VVRVLGPSAVSTFAEGTTRILSHSGEGIRPAELGGTVASMVLRGLVPVLGLAVVLAVVGGVAQVGFVFAPKAVKPKLSNLSLRSGVAKFKPTTQLWELARNGAKIVLLAIAVWSPINHVLSGVTTMRSLGGWLSEVDGMASSVLLRSLVLAGLIAIGDFVFNRVRMTKQLKMTKQEVKDEARQSDGDPVVKGRRRQFARELSRNRMIGAVAAADVVIINPVRFAVALAYEENEPAPRVVAKGAGRMARQIRQEAYRHGVVVTHDPPLARALYRRCQVGHFVPKALFEAVAVVLAAVYRRRWRQRVQTGAGVR
jgi:flagellar biosynthesis protein FlhB